MAVLLQLLHTPLRHQLTRHVGVLLDKSLQHFLTAPLTHHITLLQREETAPEYLETQGLQLTNLLLMCLSMRDSLVVTVLYVGVLDEEDSELLVGTEESSGEGGWNHVICYI